MPFYFLMPKIRRKKILNVVEDINNPVINKGYPIQKFSAEVK